MEAKPLPTLLQRVTIALPVNESAITAMIVTVGVLMITVIYLWRRYVGWIVKRSECGPYQNLVFCHVE